MTMKKITKHTIKTYIDEFGDGAIVKSRGVEIVGSPGATFDVNGKPKPLGYWLLAVKDAAPAKKTSTAYKTSKAKMAKIKKRLAILEKANKKALAKEWLSQDECSCKSPAVASIKKTGFGMCKCGSIWKSVKDKSNKT